MEIKKPQMIAHRGLSGVEKQNTAAAFVAAGNRSFFGIETDVHRTGDGHFVVIHDDNALHFSGDDINVEHSSLELIRAVRLYDLGEGNKKRGDLVIPTLEEYFSICARYQKRAILELKTKDFTKEETAEILRLANETGVGDNVTYISFYWDDLMVLRELKPDADAQFLTSNFDEELVQKLVNAKLDLDIRESAITGAEQLELCHKNGIKVNCWTVNNPARAKELSDWGIDQITSNILEEVDF